MSIAGSSSGEASKTLRSSASRERRPGWPERTSGDGVRSAPNRGQLVRGPRNTLRLQRQIDRISLERVPL